MNQTDAQNLFDVIKTFTHLKDFRKWASEQGYDPDFQEDDNTEPDTLFVGLENLMSELDGARHISNLSHQPKRQVKVFMPNEHSIYADTLDNTIYSDDSSQFHILNY